MTDVTEFRLEVRDGNLDFRGIGPAYGSRGTLLLERVPVNARLEKSLAGMRKMGREMAKANNCPFNDLTA